MKKLICAVLALVLAVGISACSNKSAKQDNSADLVSTTYNEYTTIKPTVTSVEIKAPVMKTDDWYTFEHSQYNSSDEITVSLCIPEQYTVDGTVIYDALNKKYAEIVGAVVYKDGQTAYDTVKMSDTHNDLKCINRQEGDTAFADNSHPCVLAAFEAPADNGEDKTYTYNYALDFGDYCVILSICADNELDSMPTEHSVLLEDFTVK